ncbi:tetratricopeptide repeat protein [Rhodohalobacter halophilus]|uniref:tetratricopeptide repeat protein n=1 Tax=Rhodohalobacter halophilus TaxID=1812810 RepID=UPI00083F8417|nr:tetratricopeptide repeat protein [Rhodohalobacter halophilus]
MSNPNDKIKRLAFNLKKNPNDSFSKFALALELLKRDQVTKAVVLFESILKQDSDYLGVYYHLGKLYQRMGNHQQAGELFNRGIELAKDQKNRRTELELSEALENLKIETDYED